MGENITEGTPTGLNDMNGQRLEIVTSLAIHAGFLFPVS
jgi:hypothetical protein